LLNVTEEEVNEWADELRNRGMIEVHPRFLGGIDLTLTKDTLKRVKKTEEEEKIKKVRDELDRLRKEEKSRQGDAEE